MTKERMSQKVESELAAEAEEINSKTYVTSEEKKDGRHRYKQALSREVHQQGREISMCSIEMGVINVMCSRR
eukprot:11683768-Heterocapsa_arctica.AAC.1